MTLLKITTKMKEHKRLVDVAVDKVNTRIKRVIN